MAGSGSSSGSGSGSGSGSDSSSSLYAMMAMSAISSIGTAYSQSRAMKAQGDYQAAIARTNASIAGLKSDQAIEAGDIAASRRTMQAESAIASRRAMAGASGTDVNTGSNALTQIGEDFAGKMDSLTIRTNAQRQAWGYKTQGIQDTFEGQMSKMTAASQSQQTLLNGGLASISGPLAIYGNYLRWSRGMGGGSGTQTTPYSDVGTGTDVRTS